MGLATRRCFSTRDWREVALLWKIFTSRQTGEWTMDHESNVKFPTSFSDIVPLSCKKNPSAIRISAAGASSIAWDTCTSLSLRRHSEIQNHSGNSTPLTQSRLCRHYTSTETTASAKSENCEGREIHLLGLDVFTTALPPKKHVPCLRWFFWK